jgi:hypothetical protein
LLVIVGAISYNIYNKNKLRWILEYRPDMMKCAFA